MPYTIFLPDLKVSVGFTTIGRLLKPTVTKQDRPKPKGCSGKDWQRCDKTFLLLVSTWLHQQAASAVQLFRFYRRREKDARFSCSRRSFCEAVSPFSGHSLKRGASSERALASPLTSAAWARAESRHRKKRAQLPNNDLHCSLRSSNTQGVFTPDWEFVQEQNHY